MSARLLPLLALAGCTHAVIPIQPMPRQIEQAPYPTEEAGPAWAARCEQWDDWDKPALPVQIHGGTYLVGTCGIAAILVKGDDGHVLIDTGTEQSADLVARNVARVGARIGDIDFLLSSHEHLDHVGGTARLRQLSGAQNIASEAQAAVFATGAAHPDDPQAGMHPPLPAVQVDRIVGDGDIVRTATHEFTAIATPGHTPGALSWRWVDCDGGDCRTIVYADSLSPISRDDYRFSDHPDYVAAMRAGLDRLAASDCDILLTPHPGSSDMRDRLAGTAPLVDEDGCRAYADKMRARLDARLAEEAQ